MVRIILLVALSAIALLCFLLCVYSIRRYMQTRHVKEVGKRKNPWLGRAIISFVVSMLAILGVYHLKKEGDEEHADKTG